MSQSINHNLNISFIPSGSTLSAYIQNIFKGVENHMASSFEDPLDLSKSGQPLTEFILLRIGHSRASRGTNRIGSRTGQFHL